MAPGSGAAERMLVRDGRIAVTGPAAAVRAAADPPSAAVVRLDGATVVPGLIDAHCHVMQVGYLAAGADCSQPGGAGYRGDPGLAARGPLDGTPAGSWVTGNSGYVEYKLAESGGTRPGRTWTRP